MIFEELIKTDKYKAAQYLYLEFSSFCFDVKKNETIPSSFLNETNVVPFICKLKNYKKLLDQYNTFFLRLSRYNDEKIIFILEDITHILSFDVKNIMYDLISNSMETSMKLNNIALSVFKDYSTAIKTIDNRFEKYALRLNWREIHNLDYNFISKSYFYND